MMKWARRLLLSILAVMLLPPASVPAREDTARLTFTRSASHGRGTVPYRIQPGDTLSNIVERQYGETEYVRKVKYFQQLRRLNPTLTNIHHIKPGQLVWLFPAEPPARPGTVRADRRLVQARSGDTLYQILRRELHVPEELLPRALEALKKANPGIQNPDRILPGQNISLPAITLDLPRSGTATAGIPQGGPPAEIPAAPASISSPPAAASLLPSPATGRLAALSAVIARLQGSVLTTGWYYVPLPDGGQMTIDCGLVPVVELPDGSVIFLDASARMPDAFKSLTGNSPGRQAWVRTGLDEPLPDALKTVLSRSRTFVMEKNLRTISGGDGLRIGLRPDWLITGRLPASRGPRTWGLRTGLDPEDLLPAALSHALDRSGLPVIEVLSDGRVAPRPDKPAVAGKVPHLKSADTVELAHALLAALDFQPRRNAAVQVFSPAENGFNLSVNADLLVEGNGRAVMFRTKTLPAQFVAGLRKKNISFIQLTVGAGKTGVVAQVLKGMGIAYTTGLFSLPLPPGARPGQITLHLTGLKIGEGERILYLTEADIDPGLYDWLTAQGGIRIFRF
ncbi:MAG TPA: LysM peptidoglycan-binding domain-containing protein [Syntrophales bacterium]|nr:LysM peptidoglycan-binding domain-containing protein [Syntrophales bacterium]